MMFRRAFAVLAGGFGCQAACAHAGSAAGWLHPLTGLDHFLAMVAVGAWSCQIGGRAIWIVPSAFVGCMLLGGLAGFEQVELPGIEVGVAASVVLLGLAIGFAQTFPVFIASAGVGLFGCFHGYAHGYEMPVMEDKLGYTLGFMGTTAMLHVIGALGAHGMLKRKGGGGVLRGLGFGSAVVGGWLVWVAGGAG